MTELLYQCIISNRFWGKAKLVNYIIIKRSGRKLKPVHVETRDYWKNLHDQCSCRVSRRYSYSENAEEHHLAVTLCLTDFFYSCGISHSVAMTKYLGMFSDRWIGKKEEPLHFVFHNTKHVKFW